MDNTAKNAHLLHAAEIGNLDEIKRLIAIGADIHAANASGTVLEILCFNGYSECVDYALQQGADVNYQGDEGMTAVMLTLYSELHIMHALQVIKILAVHGADFSLKNEYGQTVLDIIRSPDYRGSMDDAHYQEVEGFIASVHMAYEENMLLRQVVLSSASQNGAEEKLLSL